MTISLRIPHKPRMVFVQNAMSAISLYEFVFYVKTNALSVTYTLKKAAASAQISTKKGNRKIPVPLKMQYIQSQYRIGQPTQWCWFTDRVTFPPLSAGTARIT